MAAAERAGARRGVRCGDRAGGPAVPLAGLAPDRRLRPLRRRVRGGVVAGEAREHGSLVLRACPPPRLPARAPAAPPRQPARIGEPRHRERRPAPVGAGRPVATCHWLKRTTSWWTGPTWPPKDERSPALSNSTRLCARTPLRIPTPASSSWSTRP